MTNHDEIQSSTPVILIVDDNPQNLQVLGKLLQENKYEIEFSTSGAAALVWLRKRKFDLILLDINMPGMSGFEVCKTIKSDPVLNHIPVLFLSADTDRESILKGFEFGAQDYVTKPFDSRELLVRVRTHLKLKDTLEKLEKLNMTLEEKVNERTRQLEEANIKLEATNKKLFELDKTKSDFLNLISHEIRTPLNGILGPLELLKETDQSGEISDLVGILDISVHRLERFSLNALLITRLKTKQFDIRRDKIQLKDLISELLSEEENRLKSNNLSVKLIDEINDRIIIGESELIRKCIFNILENAILFSPTGGIIEIRLYAENSTVVCEIKNNGKELPVSVTDHLFELFTIGDEYKDNRTGMGLPIAKMVMDAHGGNITIGNNQEGGAFAKLSFNAIIADKKKSFFR